MNMQATKTKPLTWLSLSLKPDYVIALPSQAPY
jgi:hypothetical protein